MGKHHISVCACTYKRPRLLRRLLEELGSQQTDGLFTYSIVISDNDHLQSAKAMVSEFATVLSIPIQYCVEPQQSISLARNKAVENASGDYVAFIDDDEFPTKDWLVTLFKACEEHDVDGVLGPVKPYYDDGAPKWVIQGKFYERSTYPTGFVIDWKKGRTGNVILKKAIFDSKEPPFNPEFRTGDDQDFFRRMIERGHVFVWCNEAVAYEAVPPARWKRTFMVRRALLTGAISPKHPTFGAREIATSVIAIPAYTVALPFAFIFGPSKFMTIVVKLSHHLGRLLQVVGINPIRDPYVTS